MKLNADSIETIHSDEKIRQIGEIIGLLEETNRGIDWLVHEMEKWGLVIPHESKMGQYDLLNSCSSGFISRLSDYLKGNDIASPDEVLLKIYFWFFSDIVAGSNPRIPTKAQVSKIIALNELILRTHVFQKRDPDSTIILPTGDGQAIGFADDPIKPLELAIELDKLLKVYNKPKRGKEKLLLRIGIESGPVYFVTDLNGKENVWGPGIMLTRSIMDLAGDEQIYVGNKIAEEIVKTHPDYKDVFHHVSAYTTKYGEKITLYNAYGEGFGNKASQVKQKKIDHAHRTVKASHNFSFNAINLSLNVVDAKTMMVHHVFDWDLVNISKEEKSKILYILDGQTPKNFDKLGIKITGDNKRELKIGDVLVDKPYRKEFYVIPHKPVIPKQGIRLRLEYDWEEPDRVFNYKFLSGVKKFRYTCTLPKQFDHKNRILKIDSGTGYRIHASPPSVVKHLKDKTMITWEKSNVKNQDAYQFYW